MPSEMNNIPVMPEWLEDYRIPDEKMAECYESVPAPYRCAIKTGLALAHFNFGLMPSSISKSLQSDSAGFGKTFKSFPLKWTWLFIEGQYSAAARLACAAILPILAGVRTVKAFFMDSPSSEALTALELTGIEEIFYGDYKKLQKILNFICADDCVRKSGTALFFHSGSLSSAFSHAVTSGLSCWQEDKPPCISILRPQLFDLKILSFCLGLETIKQANASPDPYAIYLAQDDKISSDANLYLTPGCEGFWIHKNFTPDFFRKSEFLFSTISYCKN